MSLIQFSSQAQNMVLNSGFEDYWAKQTAPNYYVDTFYSKHWGHIFQFRHATVDYYYGSEHFSSWEDSFTKNLPDSLSANQGSAFIGISPLILQHEIQMEHLTGTLSTPLEQGKEYEFSFYVQFAREISRVSLSKLEVLFLESPKTRYYAPFSHYTRLFKTDKPTADLVIDVSVLQDSLGWVKFSQRYVARGGEKFFTIGLFYQGDEMSKKMLSVFNGYFDNSPESEKRKKLKRIVKKIPFIKINPYYIDPNPGQPEQECSYYLFDDVSIELVK